MAMAGAVRSGLRKGAIKSPGDSTFWNAVVRIEMREPPALGHGITR
jgi:hypothetical protein